MGSEPTPAAFVASLLELSAELRRVLAPHGSLCVELGDTYSSNGGTQPPRNDRPGQPERPPKPQAPRYREGTPRWDRPGSGQLRTEDPTPRPATTVQTRRYTYGEKEGGRSSGHDYSEEAARPVGGEGWPMAKSLALIPELYRVALAYGIYPLTGEPSPAGLWRVRNVVRWVRPNPPVGALGDKFRPGTSDMVVACTSARRFFDLDAVRSVSARTSEVPTKAKDHSAANPRSGWEGDSEECPQNPLGAPPLDWWEITPEPYAEAHFATWPSALCVRPIQAMCPRRVCTVCGEPSRRIVEAERNRTLRSDAYQVGRERSGGAFDRYGASSYATLGWSDCGHDAWRSGRVLDPFAGSGVTLAVATGNGRDALGIDLDERNLSLAFGRVGMWLEEAPLSGLAELLS